MLDATDVIEAIADATTAGKKAKARRMLNKYVEQQRAAGHKDVRTVAAIKAVITRCYGGNDNGMLGCTNIAKLKAKLLQMAKAGNPRPAKLLGKAMAKLSSAFDPVFAAEIRRLRPDWVAK